VPHCLGGLSATAVFIWYARHPTLIEVVSGRSPIFPVRICIMTVLSARWSPRCIFKTRLVGAGVSSYTARPCGLVCQSCSHCVFITSRIPLLFGGAFAGLVAGLLLQLWLLPSCLNAHGTVAILLPCYSHSPGRENSCSFPLPINLSPVSPQDR